MTDTPASPISISLDGFSEGYDDPELAGALSFMIEQHGLLQTLVTGIVELLPDSSVWRLTLTGDMVATVNRVTDRADDNPCTTDRGAGHAGAITLPHDDGTFDIVLSANALFATREDVGSVEALVAHVVAAAEHLSRHEAGHAALRLRGEDANAYQEVHGLSNSDAACRKPLAAHVDDNRIEQYTTSTRRRRCTTSTTSRTRSRTCGQSSTRPSAPGALISVRRPSAHSRPQTV